MPETLVPAAWALFVGIGFSNIALAQEAQDALPPDPSVPTEAAPVLETTPDGGNFGERLSVAVGSDVVTEYISRGIMFSREVSLQPGATVTMTLPELEGGAVTGASAFVGVWNSVKLGSVPDRSDGTFGRFFENDLYAGLSLTLGEEWTLSTTYYRYESLGDAFAGYDDFELIATFDDSGMWPDSPALRNFRLTPSLRMVQESGRPGRKDALYIQPSITPSFDADLFGADVNVAVPIMVGLSDQYYDGADGGYETFGFFRTGMLLSMRPAQRSAPGLRIKGGFDLWLPNADAVTGLDRYDLVGRIGVAWSL